MFFSHCPELDIGSQGETVDEANNKLKDAWKCTYRRDGKSA